MGAVLGCSLPARQRRDNNRPLIVPENRPPPRTPLRVISGYDPAPDRRDRSRVSCGAFRSQRFARRRSSTRGGNNRHVIRLGSLQAASISPHFSRDNPSPRRPGAARLREHRITCSIRIVVRRHGHRTGLAVTSRRHREETATGRSERGRGGAGNRWGVDPASGRPGRRTEATRLGVLAGSSSAWSISRGPAWVNPAPPLLGGPVRPLPGRGRRPPADGS